MTTARTLLAATGVAVLAAGTVLLTSCGQDGSGPGEVEAPTGKLSGVVMEATRSTPIAGATVSAENRQATTGADGAFELAGLPIRSVLLKVSAPAYEPFEQEISVQAGDNRRDVRLSVQTFFKYTVGADSFGVYVPPFVDSLRGVLFVIGGAGSVVDGRLIGTTLGLVRGSPVVDNEYLSSSAFFDWHTKLRAFADDQRFALVGEHVNRAVYSGNGLNLVRVMITSVGQRVSHPELAQAPLLLIGQSWGAGRVLEYTQVDGARVIGFIAMKYVNGSYLMPEALAVPGYLFMGEEDEIGNNPTISRAFEVNRQAGAIWALAVEPGAGHAYVSNVDLLIEWMKTVTALRLPTNPVTGQPALLRSVDPAAGWLGNRVTFEIGDSGCYNADTDVAAWLPSEQAAHRWQAMVSAGSVTTVLGC